MLKNVIQRGTKQGDPISPILVNSVLESIFRVIKRQWETRGYGVRLRQNASQSITNLRFADDVLLIGKSLHEVEEMLTDLSQEAGKYGPEMHMGKTKVFSQPPGKVKINEQEVEVLDPHASSMYLGKSLCLTDVHDTELQHRIARAWANFAVLKTSGATRSMSLIIDYGSSTQ